MRTAGSILLSIQAGLTLLLGLICGFVAIVGSLMMWLNPQPGDPHPLFMGLFYGFIALIALFLAVIQASGAWAAHKSSSYTMAMVGSVAAILSGAMCCNMVGLGLGITACALLAAASAEFQDPTGDFYNEV